ncbi:hypothetical protein ACE193_23705 [Bernardetia sp. OM2101]|uniref:hypothetical protein n=1 Tax=Bernardetia sp. OM2101 TaxID=3344876 RepID=UPI0035CF5357
MVHAELDYLETKYYAIFENMEYVEIDNIEAAFKQPKKAIFAVKKQNYGTTKSHYNDNFFAHSEYTFYKNDLNEYKVKKSDWVLLNIRESQTRGRETFYKISDPNGVIRHLPNYVLMKSVGSRTDYFQIKGIVLIMKKLEELSIYSNWRDYDKATSSK